MSVPFVLASPAAAHASIQTAASADTMSAGRVGAIVGALLGLAAVVVGGLALARATGRIRTGPERNGAVAALVAGPVAMVIGAVVVATADGGLGTGNGLGGGIVALLVGLAGTVLGRLALSRSGRAPARRSAV